MLVEGLIAKILPNCDDAGLQGEEPLSLAVKHFKFVARQEYDNSQTCLDDLMRKDDASRQKDIICAGRSDFYHFGWVARRKENQGMTVTNRTLPRPR